MTEGILIKFGIGWSTLKIQCPNLTLVRNGLIKPVTFMKFESKLRTFPNWLIAYEPIHDVKRMSH